MTIKGADYAWGRPGVAALKAAGVNFVCRYLSYDTAGKNLSQTEADQLRSGGIDVVANWEWGTRDMLQGYDLGHKHAAAALAQARAAGMPEGRPIYFSADFDATPTDQVKINAYLQGAADLLGGPELVGVYGGYYVVKRALDAGVCKWGWQTYGWSGGQWDSRAQIRQVKNGVQINGVDCDLDEAQVADYGQWGAATAPAPTPSIPSPRSTPPPVYRLGSRLLKQGANGSDVGDLQRLLNYYGAKLTVDSDFGPATDRAVRAFQYSRWLTSDGEVGPSTLASLLAKLGARQLDRGKRGADVAELQRELTARGYGLSADGDFGPATDAAVRRFQRLKHLSVDGVAGPQTLSALKR